MATSNYYSLIPYTSPTTMTSLIPLWRSLKIFFHILQMTFFIIFYDLIQNFTNNSLQIKITCYEGEIILYSQRVNQLVKLPSHREPVFNFLVFHKISLILLSSKRLKKQKKIFYMMVLEIYGMGLTSNTILIHSNDIVDIVCILF